MELVRAKHLLVTLTAILSLFVSAVSACACSHHEPVQRVIETSCHGPSNDARVDEGSTESQHFESDCNCFVQTPVPAIVAKKDDKRTVVAKQVDELLPFLPALGIRLDTLDEPETAFEPLRSNYQHALIASLPSRAPPRL